MPVFHMLRLDDYGISSKLGFLPSQPPLSELSDTYYQAWEDIIALVPTNEWDTVRMKIAKMPLLSTERLQGEAESHRAYTILTTLAQIYIWAGKKPSDV